MNRTSGFGSLFVFPNLNAMHIVEQNSASEIYQVFGALRHSCSILSLSRVYNSKHTH